MRDCLGDQARETGAHAEEPFIFRDHDRVLEFDGRDLLARRVGDLGNSELRQGPAAAGCGHGTWRQPGALSKYSRRLGLFVETGLAPSWFWTARGTSCTVRAASLREIGNADQRTSCRHLRPHSPLLVRRRG